MSSSSTETLVDLTMPQMGVSVSEGTLVEWRKQPGDWVAYEEAVCDISTDKIDTEVPSPVAGRLAEVLVEVGATVEVGTVLARIATDALPGEAHASEGAAAPPPPPTTSEAAAATGDAPAPSTPSAAPEPARAARANGDGGRRYSPVVQRIAAEHGVDLDRVEGTGRGGRVRKQDVLAVVREARPAARRARRAAAAHRVALPPRPRRRPPPRRGRPDRARSPARSRGCAGRSAST